MASKLTDVLFVIPTVMSRPQLEQSTAIKLAKDFPYCRVLFIANTPNDADFNDFDEDKRILNLEKYTSDKLFCISKALNLGLSKRLDEKYFIFIQSDMLCEPHTIEKAIQLIDDPSMNTGVVGLVKHSNFDKFNKTINHPDHGTLSKVLWADGMMACSMDLFDQIGIFDEIYLGDKESQDFCYRAQKGGFNNYIPHGSKWKHNTVGFSRKITKYDKQLFLNTVNQSRDIFNTRWSEWEQNLKHTFA